VAIRRKSDVPNLGRSKVQPGYFNNELSTDQKFYGVYVGIVKNTRDIQHMGRLQVYLPDWGGDEDNRAIWRTVSYCAPFGGSTPAMERFWELGIDYDHTPTSYGFWAVPPDVGNKVLIMFINGDQARGIWIGVLYDNFMNFNVPGLAAYDEHDSPDTVHEFQNVSEYNKFDKGITNPLLPSLRPWHKRQYDRMSQTAQHEDPYRGWTTSSAQRETPANVYGMSTPGPIDPDAIDVEKTFKRAGGHTFVMDDGDIEGENRLIRLRTRGGAQLLLNDTHGFVYICNKMGTAWVELDRNGNVEVFSNNTISLRSNEDINMRADRDFNLDIGRDLNIYMPNDYKTNEEKKDQDELGLKFQYSKIAGLKSPPPEGSIILHNIEGEVHTTIDKGSVYHTMGDGNYNHRLVNGSYYRQIVSGVFNGRTASNHFQRVDGRSMLRTKGNAVISSDSVLSTDGKIGVKHFSGGEMNIKAADSLKMGAGPEMHFTADDLIAGDAAFVEWNDGVAVAPTGTIWIDRVSGANEAKKPELQEFEDMVKYDPKEGPVTDTVKRRLTRYPTMEPYGGLRGKPGWGTLYHIDETTTGFFEAVSGVEIPADKLEVKEKPVEYSIGKVQPPYSPEIVEVPEPVDGTPTANDVPGQYVGVGYDAFGNPVYEKRGNSTATPPAAADLSGKGVNIIKESEGLNLSVDTNSHTKKQSIGYGHILNPGTVVQNTVREVGESDTEILVNSTENYPPFAHKAKLGVSSEWISWTKKTPNKLLGVKRGLYGSRQQKHIKGTPLTFYGETYLNGITRPEADALFDNDITKAIEAVRKHIKSPITKNQSDALISLAHSLGPVAFANSTVVTAINQKNFAKATTEFMRYNRVAKIVPVYENGIVSKVPQTAINSGLTARRLKEAKLFSTLT
jgi:GH24 family phage-related lysozyme (muramidase)|tara:strand:- start:17200 stop:19902 length:2703 start_codon:yes stop_codon:yes gene_type:complete